MTEREYVSLREYFDARFRDIERQIIDIHQDFDRLVDRYEKRHEELVRSIDISEGRRLGTVGFWAVMATVLMITTGIATTLVFILKP